MLMHETDMSMWVARAVQGFVLYVRNSVLLVLTRSIARLPSTMPSKAAPSLAHAVNEVTSSTRMSAMVFSWVFKWVSGRLMRGNKAEGRLHGSG